MREADFGYRLRMGDYRILFDLEGDTIVIQKIAHRKEVYE
ncbi:MAG: type II toxin-antitoxin system RelE/ParE family toxin [Pyrinomonadaceae bacterium]